MTEVTPDQLKQAIEAEHGGTAAHVQSVPVHVSAGNLTAWNGAVQVYDLKDSPSGANRAYAWSYGLPDGQRRFFSVLRAEAVNSPRDAVKAAIAAGQGMTK